MMSAMCVEGNGWCVGCPWPGWVFSPEYSVLALRWIPMSGPIPQVDSGPVVPLTALTEGQVLL